MLENRVKLYELLAANKLDRQDKAEQWRWSGILNKVFQPDTQVDLRKNNYARFQAQGK